MERHVLLAEALGNPRLADRLAQVSRLRNQGSVLASLSTDHILKAIALQERSRNGVILMAPGASLTQWPQVQLA